MEDSKSKFQGSQPDVYLSYWPPNILASSKLPYQIYLKGVYRGTCDLSSYKVVSSTMDNID
jgi:hypothetical protein